MSYEMIPYANMPVFDEYWQIQTSLQSVPRTTEIALTHNSFCCKNCCVKYNILTCNCGQKPVLKLAWQWEETLMDLPDDIPVDRPFVSHGYNGEKEDIYFELGDCVVRGNKPMIKNHLYYFEIKVRSLLTRRDVRMDRLHYNHLSVGVGLEELPVDHNAPLGCNEKSWAYYLCRGIRMHNLNSTRYGCKFAYGSIVGVYVNMINGTVEYFLNRQSLGVAFEGLKEFTLFPMVCASSFTYIRLTAAVEIQWTLQFLCSEVIRRQKSTIVQFEQIPFLLKLYKKNSYWDLVSFQDFTDVLDLRNLLAISHKLASIKVFSYTRACKCPRIIKKMLIHNPILNLHWTLFKTTDLRKDYWLDNEYLLKAKDCTCQDLQKFWKFTKLTYLIYKDTHSIVFDTNTTQDSSVFVLKQSKEAYFYPRNNIRIFFELFHLKTAKVKPEFKIKLLLDTCNCKGISNSNKTSNAGDEFYKNMMIIEENFMSQSNRRFSIDFTLTKKRLIPTKNICGVC